MRVSLAVGQAFILKTARVKIPADRGLWTAVDFVYKERLGTAVHRTTAVYHSRASADACPRFFISWLCLCRYTVSIVRGTRDSRLFPPPRSWRYPFYTCAQNGKLYLYVRVTGGYAASRKSRSSVVRLEMRELAVGRKAELSFSGAW